MSQKKRYAAGPMWKPARDDPRREGDIIEEASDWPHAVRCVGRRELIEVPKGKWVYKATRKWKCAEGKQAGDVIDVSNMDLRTITRLLDVGHLTREDSVMEVPKQKAPVAKSAKAQQTLPKRFRKSV